MAYSLLYEPAVRVYLRNYPGLTRQGRLRLFVNIDLFLRNLADPIRLEPARRFPGTDRLLLDFLFANSDGTLHHFRFVVDDGAAAMGVLQIVYAEGRPGQPSP